MELCYQKCLHLSEELYNAKSTQEIQAIASHILFLPNQDHYFQLRFFKYYDSDFESYFKLGWLLPMRMAYDYNEPLKFYSVLEDAKKLEADGWLNSECQNGSTKFNREARLFAFISELSKFPAECIKFWMHDYRNFLEELANTGVLKNKMVFKLFNILIVRTSNTSRLPRPDFFSICARKEKVWPS